MYQSGQASVSTVVTVILSVTLGTTSVIIVLPQTLAITNATSAAAELFSIIDKPSQLDPLSTEGKRPSTCDGEIEIRNLSFAYPTRFGAPVLQSLNLSIPAGKTTALVGPSGCGKSTVVGLLERWYQPTSGQILLDSCDIADLNTNWLRSNVRLVQQEPTLFQGTVYENVVKGLIGEQCKLPEKEKLRLVQEACKAADAHDFIVKSLPQGYDTQLGESARMLSGGQRQRISIARSIVSNPKVLLFDEATSALDPRAEKAVQDALNRVSLNKTTLIIAHKLATVMAADNIAVMANGKVVEQGTHKELLVQDGLYAAMVRSQDLGTGPSTEGVEGAPDELAESRGTDGNLGPTVSLQRTQSTNMPQKADTKADHPAAGTLEYSLIRCIFIMLKENPKLYKWYGLMLVAYVLIGGTYPVQAFLFSRLINVFTLQGAEAIQQTNFYALMLFVLALCNLVGYFNIGLVSPDVQCSCRSA